MVTHCQALVEMYVIIRIRKEHKALFDRDRSCCYVVDKPLTMYSRVPSLIPDSDSLSDETLCHSPISI